MEFHITTLVLQCNCNTKLANSERQSKFRFYIIIKTDSSYYLNSINLLILVWTQIMLLLR